MNNRIKKTNELANGMSESQKAKISAAFQKDEERVIKSKTFEVLMADNLLEQNVDRQE